KTRWRPTRTSAMLAYRRMRGVRWYIAHIVALATGAAPLACDLGLDVDALSRGCPDCVDASSADGAARTDAASCSSLHGPAMVRTASLGIDRTEVTNEEYGAFLASGFHLGASAAGCDPTESYVPAAGWPAPPERSGRPVTRVTWCAARAFCAWAGKRLCGARM